MGQRCGNYMNWANVSVTPQAQGAQTILINEVTDCAPMLEQNNEKFYGDNRRFPKLIRPTEYQRGVSITTGDVGTANSVPVDQPCTVKFTLCDAKNGTGTGAINYTVVNAVMKSNGVKGPNNKFGEVTLQFECYGDDSNAPDTDPFSFTVTQ